ncbi:MAG: FHA domain-containing protein [Bacteroidetes bacterium]|nr:FHA domain-containing protein [Bacteroidota bacterium]MCW5897110.1 FHA domain-containing protein [Bacteroidota bacterium]
MTSVTYSADGSLVLNTPTALPGVLDLLIVGGGPAGTAAAFRAKELGLNALVIDYDDLMKRIRDYPKDKLILPDFGGGDRMRFPKGGNLISALHFSAIDKDEMVDEWKRLYVANSIPAQIGIELLGLQRRGDGVWQVKTWNHNTKSEQTIPARHIAVGIGRGVPRRFDIPGNTDGIAYRLADAHANVNGPALVIGGGTSAAEAVIAISNAKVKANESSAVYWSYRGDKLPKVSKALADVFFEAYIGNGNIRYFPNSEPVAIVTADDKREYLSLRTDRKSIPGRPNETSHLEFSKELCIACIGEDIPEAFLNSLGIRMVTGGPANKKRMCVTSLLETQQPNVYLIGDILSQVYLETQDFNADPSTFREVKHRGNIKAGMIDGVIVAEIVAQRVAGKKEIEVNVQLADEAPTSDQPPVPLSPLMTVFSKITEPPQEKTPDKGAYLVRLTAGGVEEDEFAVNMNGVTTIGRKFCDIVFPEDANLSERHASISHSGDGFSLRDDGSQTGVFLRTTEAKPVEVTDGDLVRLGRQFLIFRQENGQPAFFHYDQSGKQVGKYFPAQEKAIVLGREAPDITLDAKDMTLSRRHLSIATKDRKVFIKDLKSVNGTYLKVRNAVRIEPGEMFRVGSQAFRLDLQEEIVVDRVRVTTKAPSVAKPVAKPVEPVSAPAASGMVVIFKGLDKTVPFDPGQTICTVAENSGIKIVAECHAGICGSDPVRIISGGEHLNPVGEDERGTLEDICGLKPGECRLACMAKPSGAVELEILAS